MFKRAIILLTFVFFAVFLVSCEPSGVEISDKNLLMQIAEEIELTGEVSDNFSLPNTFENPDITITWSSNNAAIIILAGNQAIVSRGNEDITVTLTALLKLNDETYEHEYNVIVKAQESVGTVTVEFTVYLPEGTPMDKDVYIAGDFGAGSGMPEWDPKSELGKATRIDETTATFTLVYDNLYEDITISYTWSLGSWETVEKTESGDELQDRTEYITNISSHVYIENIVERWADSDQTPGGGDPGDPNSDLFTEFEWTLVVNLPSYTPENDDIYILGNFPENTGLSQWGEGATNPLNKLQRHGNTARITILFTELTENVTLKFKVTRGGYETVEGDENRAYIEDREYIISREIAEHTFEITVLSWEDVDPSLTDENKLAAAVSDLTINQNIYDELTLPFEGLYGALISWTSDNEAIVIEDGLVTVTRIETDVDVTLTATITLGSLSETKAFNVIVRSADIEVQTLTVEFTVTLPAGTPMDEDIYIAGDFSLSGFSQWAPDDPLGKATRVDETTATLTLVYEGLEEDITIFYKWTLGSWDSVERSIDNKNIDNRTVVIDHTLSSMIIEDSVARWANILGPTEPGPYTEFEWTLIVHLPDNTPIHDDIYIFALFPENSGLSEWGGADNPLNKLTREGNIATIIILFTELNDKFDMYFKITRGNWEKVETDQNGYDISNRHYGISRDIQSHTFEITVASWKDIDPSLTDENKLAAAVSDLTINQNIYDELTLPFEGLYGALISWTSDNEAIVIEDGLVTVTRIETDVDVTLTATITLGSLSETKAFNVIVKSADTEVQTLTVEFTVTLPAGTPMDEDIYIAGDFSLSGFSQWAPDDPLGKATRVDETTATLTLVYEGLEEDITIFYKWTLGSWDSVERSIDDKNIDNRSVVIDHTLSSMIIEDSVARWTNILGPTEPGPYTEFEWTLIVHLPDNTPIHDDIYIFGLFPENSGLSEIGRAS